MTGLVILIIALALYFMCCDVLYRAIADRKANLAALPNKRKPDGFSPWDDYRAQIDEGVHWYEAQATERVTIRSADGLTLVAHYLPSTGSDRTLLMAHGYRSNIAAFDFSCAFEPFHKLGYNLLLIDQRAHGESGGRYIGFGVPERHDIVRWAEFLNERYHPRAVILDGMSMGSTTVLMSLSLNLPENVLGAIVDCGFTTPKAIIHHVMKTALRLPIAPLWPGISLCSRIRSGYSLSGASALESLGHAKVPVLFIHGEDDRYVPCSMGRANYEACASRKQWVSVPGAGHGMSYMVDGEKVSATLGAFLDTLEVT